MGWGVVLLTMVAVPPILALTVPGVSTVSAASPPVARDDVARTDAATTVNSLVVGNDFDPDGDGFSVISIVTPAHGTVANFGSSINYTPDAGFSGVESITYTIQDSTGSTANAVLTVWVDTGVLGPDSPVTGRDYTYVYQGASVAVTTAELLSNDSDPQGQALTVVAVSEPGLDGTLTGDLVAGFSYTPSNDPAQINTDHLLHYLVTDTDGHVTQEDIVIRILAAGDPNQPPVAVPDIATSTGATVNSLVVGNDFDPDGDGFSVVKVLTPAHGTVANFGSSINYTPNPGFSGIETITYILRDDHGLLSTGLLVVSVNVTGDQPPIAGSASYAVAAGDTLSIILSAVDPDGQPLTWSFVTTPVGSLTGALTGAAPTLTYTAPATPQTDSFIYKVSEIGRAHV